MCIPSKIVIKKVDKYAKAAMFLIMLLNLAVGALYCRVRQIWTIDRQELFVCRCSESCRYEVRFGNVHNPQVAF